jgi:hypothetical protein
LKSVRKLLQKPLKPNEFTQSVRKQAYVEIGLDVSSCYSGEKNLKGIEGFFNNYFQTGESCFDVLFRHPLEKNQKLPTGFIQNVPECYMDSLGNLK